MEFTQHEKYLRGEWLEGGAHSESEAHETVRSRTAPQSKALEDGDREHLRHLTTEPGWLILLKLLDSRIEKLEDDAKAASKIDPFNPELSKIWARVSGLEAAKAEMLIVLDNELQALAEGGEQGDAEIL